MSALMFGKLVQLVCIFTHHLIKFLYLLKASLRFCFIFENKTEKTLNLSLLFFQRIKTLQTIAQSMWIYFNS